MLKSTVLGLRGPFPHLLCSICTGILLTQHNVLVAHNRQQSHTRIEGQLETLKNMQNINQEQVDIISSLKYSVQQLKQNGKFLKIVIDIIKMLKI